MDEIEIAGVVSTRWMFWVERFMGVLKGLIRQRDRPEGSMSEGWVLGECMYYLAASTLSMLMKMHRANGR